VDARKKMKKESGKPLKIIQGIWKGEKDWRIEELPSPEAWKLMEKSLGKVINLAEAALMPMQWRISCDSQEDNSCAAKVGATILEKINKSKIPKEIMCQNRKRKLRAS
jgi:hypothetical protein